MIYKYADLYCDDSGNEIQELIAQENIGKNKYVVLLDAITPFGITTKKQEITGATSLKEAFELLPATISKLEAKQKEEMTKQRLAQPSKSGLIV